MSYKIPKGKVQLHVLISEDVVSELRKLIALKYEGSKLKGVLSHEVEQALRNWIALHKSREHTQVHAKVNPSPKAYRVFQEVKAWLREVKGIEFEEGVNQVPRKLLVEAISAVRGGDERTIRRWLREFERFKLIKWIAPEVAEVV